MVEDQFVIIWTWKQLARDENSTHQTANLSESQLLRMNRQHKLYFFDMTSLTRLSCCCLTGWGNGVAVDVYQILWF